MEIETKDLWQAAYLIAKGGELNNVFLRPNNHKGQEVFFIIRDENIKKLLEEYRTGQAECRLSMLRISIKHLKEEIFRLTREDRNKDKKYLSLNTPQSTAHRYVKYGD